MSAGRVCVSRSSTRLETSSKSSATASGSETAEALDQIVNSDCDQIDQLSVQFVYNGHNVQVQGDGSIAVDGTVYDHGDM